MTPLQAELVDCVRTGMRARYWGQVMLARQVGISEKHLSQLLNGVVEGSLSMWQRLLDCVDIPSVADQAEVLAEMDAEADGDVNR